LRFILKLPQPHIPSVRVKVVMPSMNAATAAVSQAAAVPAVQVLSIPSQVRWVSRLSGSPLPQNLSSGCKRGVSSNRVKSQAVTEEFEEEPSEKIFIHKDFHPQSDTNVLAEFEPGHIPGFDFFSIEAEINPGLTLEFRQK
jgi:hypothetical protein